MYLPLRLVMEWRRRRKGLAWQAVLARAAPVVCLPTPPVARRIGPRSSVFHDAIRQNADLVDKTRPKAHAVVPDRCIVLSYAKLVVRHTKSIQNICARHSRPDDVCLSFIYDVRRRPGYRCADSNSYATSSPTAKPTQTDRATGTTHQRRA